MRRRILRAGRRIALYVLAVYLVVPLLGVAIYGFVPPPITPLMVIRLLEGEGLDKDWRGLEEISPHVPDAAIAAEDNLFCEHLGFDWGSLGDSFAALAEGDPTRGASTISMQAAKNLFLWPQRDFVRKLLEPYPTLLLELFWSKRRIIEVYLNIVEWGPGIYGIEAAAQHHFGKPAAKLSRRQAALLAVVLPNPRRWSAAAPTGYIESRAQTIARRIGQLGPLLDCVHPHESG